MLLVPGGDGFVESAMTVQQLMDALRGMPAGATVLLEDDAGYSPLGGVAFQHNGDGMPDEVILQPDLTPD